MSKPKKRAKKKRSKKLSEKELLLRRIKYLENRLRKHEKSRFIGPMLPGKKQHKPSKKLVESARAKMKLFLGEVKGQLELAEVAAHYRSYVNSDGSIDAEIKVPVQNFDLNDLLVTIEDAGRWDDLEGFWIVGGVHMNNEELTGSPTIDKRPQMIRTHSFRGNRAGAMFFTLREKVIPNVEMAGGSINQVSIRIVWHPENYQPRRRR